MTGSSHPSATNAPAVQRLRRIANGRLPAAAPISAVATGPIAIVTAAAFAVVAAATFAVVIASAFTRPDAPTPEAGARRAADLECLAKNVYYEARGEPLVGQYAVAEVTMNRVASPLFPSSVCEVVHARGAFSWTYHTATLPEPYGYEWRRAQAVASSVYDNIEAPLVGGALFYHAIYVSPDWAATRSQVALIGQHMFYE